MEQRVLGTGGPKLSVVGLGCNNFGMRIDARALGVRRPRRARRRDHPLRHRRDVRRRQVGGVPRRGARLPSGRGRDRHQVHRPAPRTSRTRRECSPPASARPPRAACAASEPTGSTSTTSTTPTPTPRRGGARDARRLWSATGKVLHIASSNVDADSSPSSSRSRPNAAGPGSPAPRSSGTCSTVRSRATSYPRRQARAGSGPLLPARLGPAHRQVPAGRAVPRRHSVGSFGVLRHVGHAGELRQGRGVHRLRRPTGAHRHRTGDRLAPRPADGDLGDRRGDQPGAGRRQRRRCRLDPQRGRTRPPSPRS